MKFNLACTSILLLFVLSGCATFNEKFKAKSVPHIGLFADSTVTMMSDIDLRLTRDETVLVRRYLSRDEPEETHARKLDEELQETIENLVTYSIDIVNIAETTTSETNKVAIYADYITGFRDEMLAEGRIELENFDSTIQKIREQETFLKALREAQPLLNAAIVRTAVRVDTLIDAVDAVALKIDMKIDADYADIIQYRKTIKREKFDILTAFELMYQVYHNDEPDLRKLRESGVIWDPKIIPEGAPTREDLGVLVRHLEARLDALHAVQEEINSDWEDYMAIHRELNSANDKTVQGVKKSRMLLLTWVRAHQKMAAGTTDPADWFDLGEVTKDLLKKAPGAIF